MTLEFVVVALFLSLFLLLFYAVGQIRKRDTHIRKLYNQLHTAEGLIEKQRGQLEQAKLQLVDANVVNEALKKQAIPWAKNPPEDGSIIFVGVSMKFTPYSEKSNQFKRGIKGRWQMCNGYGGWENIPTPPPVWYLPSHPPREDLRPDQKIRFSLK